MFNPLTVGTFSARISVFRMIAIDRLRHDFCGRSFAGSPGAAEQICMSHTPRVYLVFEGGNYMLLSAYIVKTLRSEFSV